MNSLSDEVLLSIMENLRPLGVVTFRLTCKRIHRLTYDKSLWMSIFRSEEDTLMVPHITTCSLSNFQTVFLERCLVRAQKADLCWNNPMNRPTRARQIMVPIESDHDEILCAKQFGADQYLVVANGKSIWLYDLEGLRWSTPIAQQLLGRPSKTIDGIKFRYNAVTMYASEAHLDGQAIAHFARRMTYISEIRRYSIVSVPLSYYLVCFAFQNLTTNRPTVAVVSYSELYRIKSSSIPLINRVNVFEFPGDVHINTQRHFLVCLPYGNLHKGIIHNMATNQTFAIEIHSNLKGGEAFHTALGPQHLFLEVFITGGGSIWEIFPLPLAQLPSTCRDDKQRGHSINPILSFHMDSDATDLSLTGKSVLYDRCYRETYLGYPSLPLPTAENVHLSLQNDIALISRVPAHEHPYLALGLQSLSLTTDSITGSPPGEPMSLRGATNAFLTPYAVYHVFNSIGSSRSIMCPRRVDKSTPTTKVLGLQIRMRDIHDIETRVATFHVGECHQKHWSMAIDFNGSGGRISLFNHKDNVPLVSVLDYF